MICRDFPILSPIFVPCPIDDNLSLQPVSRTYSLSKNSKMSVENMMIRLKGCKGFYRLLFLIRDGKGQNNLSGMEHSVFLMEHAVFHGTRLGTRRVLIRVPSL